MSGELRLKSFEVEGFRAIRRLSLPVLGRVNLFVGENNAGKSSLLEALQLYFHRNQSASLIAYLLGIAREHADLFPTSHSGEDDDPRPLEMRAALDAAEGLFFGSFDEQPLRPIRLRSESAPPTGVAIALPWSQDPGSAFAMKRPAAVDPAVASLTYGSEEDDGFVPLSWFGRQIAIRGPKQPLPSLSIAAGGLSGSRVRQLWDEVALLGDEALVEDALRMIVPDIERIVVVGEGVSRSVLCKVAGIKRPIPIKSMGDGTNRVFGLAVTMVASRGGALLIDEVENGLHRSVHDDVWKLVFTLAEQLDVQVFATTHSWEAVVGFQAAAKASPALGMLYRLERESDGEIYAERYSEKEIAIAAEQQIEVR